MLHSGLMVRADVISDELWALLEPVLPGVAGRPGRPWNDHRPVNCDHERPIGRRAIEALKRATPSALRSHADNLAISVTAAYNPVPAATSVAVPTGLSTPTYPVL